MPPISIPEIRVTTYLNLPEAALRELNAASAYDEKVKGLEEQLLEIDNLVNDFNRELADYIDETEFDDETFYRMEKRLDELNHLKSKYGSTIADILSELRKTRPIATIAGF